MKSPFPYFGGKSAVASVIWKAFGNPGHYMEPFFGSGAVLLNRPNFNPQRNTETINDKDGYIANIWRALQADPDGVAAYCDSPVNHADLIARRAFLRRVYPELIERLCESPDYYNQKIAGYYIWSACASICNALQSKNGIPHIADTGKGIHAIGLIPEKKKSDFIGFKPYNENIYKWFRELQERLRHVRVACGDWTRICGGNWQTHCWKDVAIFFDPPYSEKADCNQNLYSEDSSTVADDVREWSLKRGKNPKYKIALSGYYDEHKSLLNEGWTVHRWKACGGYGNQGKNQTDENGVEHVNQNRFKESIFFSPHCLNYGQQLQLF